MARNFWVPAVVVEKGAFVRADESVSMALAVR